MAAARKKPSAKTQWMSKARAIGKQIERYAAFGFVTAIDAYEADDRKISRALDRLDASRRSAGVAGDPEVEKLRADLSERFRLTRNVLARNSRAQFYEGRANQLRSAAAAAVPDGFRAYQDELQLARIKGKL